MGAINNHFQSCFLPWILEEQSDVLESDWVVLLERVSGKTSLRRHQRSGDINLKSEPAIGDSCSRWQSDRAEGIERTGTE